jgi:hypothetical protein
LFESFVAGSLLLLTVAGFLNVSSAGQALVMFVVAGVVLFILVFLHSYLLLVRFSAVGIMRRNVFDV